MRGFALIVALAAAALAGCGAPMGAAVVVGVMAADSVNYYYMGPDGKTPTRAPAPDPTRTIDVQDCTQPFDPGAGNLLCR